MFPLASDDSGGRSNLLNDMTSASSGTRATSSGQAMSDRQRKQVLYEWNNTQADFPDVCAHQLFEQQVARDPDALALIGNGTSMSYRELNQRANHVAHYLRRIGVGPDVLVGVCLRRTHEMVIALLGVWKSGGAYVPLDSSYPEDRLSFMVDDASVQVLLTEERCKHLFQAMDKKAICIDSDWPTISQERDNNLETNAIPSHLAYVIYTSGSTGKPKGAMIHHRGLVNYLWWAIREYGVEPGGSVPVHSSISFDLTVTSLYPALMTGGQVELLAEDQGAQNLLAALRRKKGRNLVKITPAHLEALNLQLSPEDVQGMTRAFVIGGENLLAESLRLWRESSPSTRLINEYGPTETVVGCCIYEVKPDDPRSGSVPIGRPIANTQLYILDESLNPVPPGATGELYIGGVGVARGYLNRPELTQERFLPDPFSKQSGATIYKSGDLARYRQDGVLEYLGRVDNQVKIRGYRIELGEIEAVLASAPEVQTCAVLAREDTPGDKQLVGYIVSRHLRQIEVEQLQIFLKERLPEYMVPAKFVFLQALPLTHNGKVDRKALPAPEPGDRRNGRTSERARTVIEEKLVAIWKDLFRLEDVGIHDDFFDLGGDSLLALKVMVQIRSEFSVDLQILNLFENPTIAALAANLVEVGVADTPLGNFETEQTTAVSESVKSREIRQSVTPYYFGSADAPLYGVYSPPSNTTARRAALLFCPPIGVEYMRTHYAVRLVCSQLSRAGFHVLRFDYHGTGDSSGNVNDGQFERWLDDIELAASELRAISGVDNLILGGLRMGATLAVEALASRNIMAKSVLLWDPIVLGGEYLTLLENMHAQFVAERGGQLQSTDELLGAHFPKDLRIAIQRMNLAARLQDVKIEKPALVISGDQARYDLLINSMRTRWPELLFRESDVSARWEDLRSAFEGRMAGPIIRIVAEAAESLP